MRLLVVYNGSNHLRKRPLGSSRNCSPPWSRTSTCKRVTLGWDALRDEPKEGLHAVNTVADFFLIFMGMIRLHLFSGSTWGRAGTVEA